MFAFLAQLFALSFVWVFVFRWRSTLAACGRECAIVFRENIDCWMNKLRSVEPVVCRVWFWCCLRSVVRALCFDQRLMCSAVICRVRCWLFTGHYAALSFELCRALLGCILSTGLFFVVLSAFLLCRWLCLDCYCWLCIVNCVSCATCVRLVLSLCFLCAARMTHIVVCWCTGWVTHVHCSRRSI